MVCKHADGELGTDVLFPDMSVLRCRDGKYTMGREFFSPTHSPHIDAAERVAVYLVHNANKLINESTN